MTNLPMFSTSNLRLNMKRTMSQSSADIEPPRKRQKLNDCSVKPIIDCESVPDDESVTNHKSRHLPDSNINSKVNTIITDLISSAFNIAHDSPSKTFESPKSRQLSDSINQKVDGDSDHENECCICFDHIDFPITLDCGHRFCFLCLKEIRMQCASSFNPQTFQCLDPSSNHNTNQSEDQSTFSCPYCRRTFDVKVIDEAKMKRTEWIQSIKSKDQMFESKESEDQSVVIWQYSGRRGGWWAYHSGHQKEIEEKYQRFMESMKSDNGMDLENEIVIEIGVREYVIDFAQMIQFD